MSNDIDCRQFQKALSEVGKEELRVKALDRYFCTSNKHDFKLRTTTRDISAESLGEWISEFQHVKRQQ